MKKRHFLLPLGFLLCCTDLRFLPMLDDTVSMTPENCLLCLTYFFPFDLTFTCSACPIMKAYSCKVSFKNLSFAEGHVALWEGDIFLTSCPYPIILLWCSRVDHLLFLFQISYPIELLTFKCLLPVSSFILAFSCHYNRGIHPALALWLIILWKTYHAA